MDFFAINSYNKAKKCPVGVHFEQNVSEKGVLRAATFLFGKYFLNVPGAKKTARQMIGFALEDVRCSGKDEGN